MSQTTLLNTWEKIQKTIPHDVLNIILIRETLKYELINRLAITDKDFGEIDKINFVLSELRRFQDGGVDSGLLEDNVWLDNKETKRFFMKETQQIFYNTVEEYDCDNKELIWFMTNFVEYIKKISSNKISIRFKIIDDEDNEIAWILLIFED